jgi:hypothetical protein
MAPPLTHETFHRKKTKKAFHHGDTEDAEQGKKNRFLSFLRALRASVVNALCLFHANPVHYPTAVVQCLLAPSISGKTANPIERQLLGAFGS